MLDIESTPIRDLKLLKPRCFGDDRGYFFELYRQTYTELGLAPMVQANVSRSRRHVLRGLHLQLRQPQAKLISVLRGAIFDVAVDLRPGSPSLHQWFGTELSDQNHTQLYVPVGFAHGFLVLSDEADVLYQCSDYYCPEGELGIHWNDPQIAVKWPLAVAPILSPKDSQNPTLKDVAPEKLTAFSMVS